MLDVIHYFFEDDMIPRWEQDTDVKSKVRSVLYREMYDREYKYAVETSDRHADFDVDGTSLYDPSLDGSIKPYFPPSSPEELMSILEPPVGQ